MKHDIGSQHVGHIVFLLVRITACMRDRANMKHRNSSRANTIDLLVPNASIHPRQLQSEPAYCLVEEASSPGFDGRCSIGNTLSPKEQ